MTSAAIDAEETRLLDGRVVCYQPRRGYRSAIDPILMQAAVPARPGDRVLDLGCGAGAAGLCLAHRVAGVTVTGLDIQEPLIALARESATANGMADTARFMAGDLLTPPDGIGAGAFDHVMANPPFQKAGTSRPSPDPVKAMATVEGRAELADWVRTAARLVRGGGTVTFIHHGGRGDELADLMSASLGAVTLQPVQGKPGEERPGRMIAQGIKDAAANSCRQAPLVLHEPGGDFSAPVDRILRGYADIAINRP
ncbi:MAG TPA: methyltransferase [Rhodospirillaceae bacterium]|nr:methyltransferase [Rhodospirillaceae bacterium]HCS70503.1 methyltransferase [Rhodospirillaceae bacterium]